MASYSCPALFISAPASGQGKTTVTAALARYYKNQGLNVHVFKTGPDFLDPMILEHASGNPVYQLDLWMTGESECRQLLSNAARVADLILVEGVMGLFDGDPSSADLAKTFGIPIIAIIDSTAMAQTFGAIAYGLVNYRKDIPFHGIIANNVANTNHGEMLSESILQGIHYAGGLKRSEQITLPHRHLGLHQASEIKNLDMQLDTMAAIIGDSLDTALPSPVEFKTQEKFPVNKSLNGICIGVAKDDAFSFIYQANIDLLESMGARLEYFSPLNDSQLPNVDCLWLPGGYPELFLETLASNHEMKQTLQAHHDAGKPLLAECGGMLYLMESLTNKKGQKKPMASILQGQAVMKEKLTALGMQSVEFPEGEVRGHTFHHSALETEIRPTLFSIKQRTGKQGEAVYKVKNTVASYIHFYFPSCPEVIASIFKPENTKELYHHPAMGVEV